MSILASRIVDRMLCAACRAVEYRDHAGRPVDHPLVAEHKTTVFISITAFVPFRNIFDVRGVFDRESLFVANLILFIWERTDKVQFQMILS